MRNPRTKHVQTRFKIGDLIYNHRNYAYYVVIGLKIKKDERPKNERPVFEPSDKYVLRTLSCNFYGCYNTEITITDIDSTSRSYYCHASEAYDAKIRR